VIRGAGVCTFHGGLTSTALVFRARARTRENAFRRKGVTLTTVG